jgi:DNA-binding LacI/PurR family transcriptional regulator
VVRGGKPTLADIAARTGYGTNTVSLALRGSTRISQKARDEIRKAAVSMDYIPNHSAKSLVLRKSHTVGMLLEDLTNPSLTRGGTAMQNLLSQHGYGVLFATNETAEKEEQAIEMFRSRGIDGLLIYPVVHTRLDHLRRLRERNFPVVLLIGTETSGLDAVGIDEFQGGYDATTHLIALGHTRIGAIAFVNRNTEKLAGFRHAHKVHGIPLQESQVIDPGEHSIAVGSAVMEQLASSNQDLTAVFAASDLYALGALHWARINKISVPEQLSIVGFDGIEFGEFADTPLSTIRNDASLLAQTAIDRLLMLMKSDGPLQSPIVTLLRGELVARASSARPGGRAWLSAVNK